MTPNQKDFQADAWLGMARRGEAWRGKANHTTHVLRGLQIGVAWLGWAWRCMAWLSTQRILNSPLKLGMPGRGSDWRGMARRGDAWLQHGGSNVPKAF